MLLQVLLAGAFAVTQYQGPRTNALTVTLKGSRAFDLQTNGKRTQLICREQRILLGPSVRTQESTISNTKKGSTQSLSKYQTLKMCTEVTKFFPFLP